MLSTESKYIQQISNTGIMNTDKENLHLKQNYVQRFIFIKTYVHYRIYN